ncbi:uncharacterized protein LOC126841615 [Adelges cooleyi]|uniref:uncharacterized protein LOC126837563 n=1 Tax=Adelges cooleyi TaxID=133065 RepID=UPI00217F8F9D|nr:uncharacterized protein LOC126837563 [Adelges cooleyi]XP_050427457.1 uncharacterized protein LOC126837563 [Adelges cooleyi]XP_050427513.1 uncharacterized protein LOC126837626 [Adelges cooleyi]XP_050427514.1 uncharacterized protein LOC126837626 [Adelges cooleyi]XP_050431501.1 uncharacterized protein LOC126840055 [Adelges cooleyi]XP_050434156.1 uncharacterized protein LOC126841615 [Adelges cooleyi]
MNFKNCILFLSLFVHLSKANPGLCEDPSILTRLHTKILEQGNDVTKETVIEYIKQQNVMRDFDISIFDINKILCSVWSTKMSPNEFIAVITSKFTFWDLQDIYNGIVKNRPVTKSAVKEYLREKLKLVENELTTALKETDMSWNEFYTLMVFKSLSIRYNTDQLRI